MKELVRPLYSELQGYLTQAPTIKTSNDAIYEPVYWEQVNQTIDELNTTTSKDYSRFKLTPEVEESYSSIKVTVIRLKLGGLISRLHAEYFKDEQAPFNGMPSTVNNFTQMQQQTATQTIVLEFSEYLNKKMESIPDDDKRSFLQKIKQGLGAVKSSAEIIKLILDTAKQFGFDINQVAMIFS